MNNLLKLIYVTPFTWRWETLCDNDIFFLFSFYTINASIKFTYISHISVDKNFNFYVDSIDLLVMRRS